MSAGSKEPIHGCLPRRGVHGQVVLAHCFCEFPVELVKRADLGSIKTIKPTAFEATKHTFDFAFCGAISHRSMEQESADTAADKSKLHIFETAAMVCVQFVNNTVSTDGIFEDFLKIVCVVLEEEFSADDHTRMIVYNGNEISAPFLTILIRDVWEVTAVGLIPISE